MYGVSYIGHSFVNLIELSLLNKILKRSMFNPFGISPYLFHENIRRHLFWKLLQA